MLLQHHCQNSLAEGLVRTVSEIMNDLHADKLLLCLQ